MADTKVSALAELSVPALEDLAYIVDDPAGTPASNKVSLNRLFGLLPHVCTGRLTLESGVAVSTSDQTAKTNVYFTPYHGNKVALYDGTRWKLYTFTELTLALGTITSGLPYDVYLYDNAGTLTLELLAWTNGTTRATALTTQDGVYVKTGATTRRYLGTFYTTATTTTEDSQVKRFVWNQYNQVRREMVRLETAGSWSYGSSTIRQANGSTSNQLAFVCGNPAFCEAFVSCAASASGSNSACVGVGFDSTTAYSAQSVGGMGWNNSAGANLFASFRAVAVAGYHFMAWNENSSGEGASMTFYEDYWGTEPNIAGIVGSVVG